MIRDLQMTYVLRKHAVLHIMLTHEAFYLRLHYAIWDIEVSYTISFAFRVMSPWSYGFNSMRPWIAVGNLHESAELWIQH